VTWKMSIDKAASQMSVKNQLNFDIKIGMISSFHSGINVDYLAPVWNWMTNDIGIDMNGTELP